ncbi:hypothetical protein XELAEV_18031722mg [Xenopus laevis]|uniref:Uncharacterized protein n=1 Tax=Xenopus laevis TaxID=8355 RepID=A0A974HFZ8_XENLA|nr:hypothetical protein XELAEV_18031722mg [Xenopus laevis]
MQHWQVHRAERDSIWKLEKLMVKELKIWWDTITLEKYVSLQMVPRGLRIRKFPAYEITDTDFIKRWNNVLSDCSLKLMQLLVERNQGVLDELNANINILQEQFKSPLAGASREDNEYDRWEINIKQKLAEIETELINTKTFKFNRDSTDYELDRVYIKWDRKHKTKWPKSILKGKKKKHVSFNSNDDTECTENMLEQSSVSSLSSVSSRSTQEQHNNRAMEVFSRVTQSTPEKAGKKGKGLSFSPTNNFELLDTIIDINKFVRKLRKHFLRMNDTPQEMGENNNEHTQVIDDTRDTVTPGDSTMYKDLGSSCYFVEQRAGFLLDSLCTENGEGTDRVNLDLSSLRKIKKQSDFYPVNSRGTLTDAFQELVERDLTKLWQEQKFKGAAGNLTYDQKRALRELKLNKNLVFKQADKGGLLVPGVAGSCTGTLGVRGKLQEVLAWSHTALIYSKSTLKGALQGYEISVASLTEEDQRQAEDGTFELCCTTLQIYNRSGYMETPEKNRCCGEESWRGAVEKTVKGGVGG